METQRKYVMTDEVWDMLMEALEQAIDYKLHFTPYPEIAEFEVEQMHRLIDTVEVREELYHPESTMAILNEDDDEEVMA